VREENDGAVNEGGGGSLPSCRLSSLGSVQLHDDNPNQVL